MPTGRWLSVFGSAALVCLVLLGATGVGLSFVYVPSAAQAWTSLEILDYEAPLGWYLRALHDWATSFLIALLSIHLARIYVAGAQAFARGLAWASACLVLVLVLAMAATGQGLRFDQDAYWGIGVAVAIFARAPFVGEALVAGLLGGPGIGAATLSRFFALHAFILPGLLFAALVWHLGTLLGSGTRQEWGSREKTVAAHLAFAAVVLLAVAGSAALFGPKGPSGPPDPTLAGVAPRPDFFLVPLVSSLALLPSFARTVALWLVPAIALGLLFAVPWLDPGGARSPRGRAVALAGVTGIFFVLGGLVWAGRASPWSPALEAWSSEAPPERTLAGRSPLELAGAVVFQARQCPSCHAVEGSGGRPGPGLADVGTRLGRDEIVAFVREGSENMPAYRGLLSSDEEAALVAWLVTLGGSGASPARERP